MFWKLMSEWVKKREKEMGKDEADIGTAYFITGTSLSELVAQQPQIQSNQIKSNTN